MKTKTLLFHLLMVAVGINMLIDLYHIRSIIFGNGIFPHGMPGIGDSISFLICIALFVLMIRMGNKIHLTLFLACLSIGIIMVVGQLLFRYTVTISILANYGLVAGMTFVFVSVLSAVDLDNYKGRCSVAFLLGVIIANIMFDGWNSIWAPLIEYWLGIILAEYSIRGITRSRTWIMEKIGW
jgi:hypothetical protein